MQQTDSQTGPEPLALNEGHVQPGFGSEGARMLRDIWNSLAWPEDAIRQLSATGQGNLPSVYAVTDLAVASIGAAALSVAMLMKRQDGSASAIEVDRVLSSRWFSQSIKPIGWSLPPTWDAIAGDYETRDGWIRLHTNAPLHRAAALRELGFEPANTDLARTTVAAAVRERRATELESAIVNRGGCAAEMRSAQAWSGHPQGIAVRSEPLLSIQAFAAGQHKPSWPLSTQRPLQGVRVLDLTRILAGPVATRFLAGYGADVLRIDPPDWHEPVVAPEITLGKKRARLDLRDRQGRAIFEQLLSQADVIVHGLRADALEQLGFGEARRRELNPGLIDVSLNAYGWTGEWRDRRGFDSLVQMSCGIAEAGMRTMEKPVPTPLPVQALDHSTGYLLAAAVVRGLVRRIDTGAGSSTRASLARTAALLTSHSLPHIRESVAMRDERLEDYNPGTESTAWGPAQRLKAPYEIDSTPAQWDLPAGNLGDSPPAW